MNTAQLRTSTRASGFTLIELLVVISIIFILAGMLFPALIQAKARGKQAKCINRCKQMNIAIQFYADEFQGYFPLDGPNDALQGNDVWFQKMRRFLGENLDTSTVLNFVKDSLGLICECACVKRQVVTGRDERRRWAQVAEDDAPRTPLGRV